MNEKIALIIEKIDKDNIGGEPSIHLNFLKYLLDKNYEVDVFCEANNSVFLKCKIFDNFLKNKNEYISKIRNGNYALIFSSRFGLKFSEINADIYSIHSHSDYYSQKTKFGIFYNLIKPKKKRIINEIKNLEKNKNAIYIFSSNQLKNDYNSLVLLNNSNVVYPYPNVIPNTSSSLKKVGDEYIFGISALGFQNKGGYLILKSAFLLKFFSKKFKLKIIYKKNCGLLQLFLIYFLGLRKYVEILPKQTDMQKFYNSIDCLVMPSQLESFGMVGAEALAFNLPVIISSNCGLKEIIKNEEYIFDFSKHKEWNLFQKMKKIMNNELDYSNNFYSLNDKENYNKTLEIHLLKAIKRKVSHA